jgi:hypothetical protein
VIRTSAIKQRSLLWCVEFQSHGLLHHAGCLNQQNLVFISVSFAAEAGDTKTWSETFA